jgi:transposase
LSSKNDNLELPTSVESCHELIKELQKQLAYCMSRIAELESRLNQNSSNSSRPPSSDFGKRVGGTGIPKVPKKLGGQNGHTGKTLFKTETPDKIIQLSTVKCSCGSELGASKGDVYQTYQVFDIPYPKLYVTEYQRMRQVCQCGQIHYGVLPDGITASVQYGSGVRAFTTLMSTSCQLSYGKTRILFNDLFGYDLNESTAVSNNRLAYDYLESTENQIKEYILESEVVHFDESGVKVGVKLNWIHVACTHLLTYLFVSPRRGKKAHEDNTSILPGFKNWAVHDCYGTYFNFTNSKHALCNAHILRELQAQIENGKHWAIGIHAFLLRLYKDSEKGTKTISNISFEKVKWKELCEQAIQVEELLLAKSTLHQKVEKHKKRGRKKRGKVLSLLDRLLKRTDALLAFAEYEVVPFTNNQAERDIRPVKTKQKIAGCFRTFNGVQQYARIQGFISTCRKQGFNVFNELKSVFENTKYYVSPLGC